MSNTFLILYDQTGSAETRDGLRLEHIEYRRGLGDALHMAGPLLDDAGSAIGSVIILRAANPADATAAALADPFVRTGVLLLRSVTPMRVAMMVPPTGM